MVKNILNFLLVFFMLSSFSFANDTEAKLQAKIEKEFGHDLTKAPFFLRFAFKDQFGKDWDASDYAQRKAFLTEYETNLEAQQAKAKADAKAAARKEKARLRAKREEDRKEKERLRAQAKEDQEEQKEEQQRQKDFDQSVRDEQRQLQQMQQQSTLR